MTLLEYVSTGCDNYHSEFTFIDGTKIPGVITTFFPDEPNEYYLVKSNDLILFKEHQKENNDFEMRNLAHKIDFKTITSVKRLN